jgi:hypothetical protein
MTDPSRWLDQAPSGGSDAVRLLRVGAALEPQPNAVDRGWTEFLALSGFGPPDGSDGGAGGPSGAEGGGGTGVAAAAGTGSAAKAGFSLSALVKAFGLGAALGVGASVGLMGIGRMTEPSRVPAQSRPAQASPPGVVAAELRPAAAASSPLPAAPLERVQPRPPLARPRAVATEAPATRELVAPSVGGLHPHSSVGSFAVDPPPVSPNLLQLEALELARAKALLDAKRPDEALKLLSAGGARFPAGPLGEEREAVTVDALVQTGRIQAARERARAFAAKHPKSPLLARVKALVEP